MSLPPSRKFIGRPAGSSHVSKSETMSGASILVQTEQTRYGSRSMTVRQPAEQIYRAVTANGMHQLPAMAASIGADVAALISRLRLDRRRAKRRVRA